MAYTVNLTDGSIFATVADGTTNTAAGFSAQAPMVLVGKNYIGYGEFLNENFIHLLENGANSVPPGAPLVGQLWWDKSTGTMKVYTGTAFKIISGATAAATAPVVNVTGDLWFDTVNQQLRVWNGTTFILVGPMVTPGAGTSGPVVTSITDNTAAPHIVIQFWVQDTLIAIMSRDATFTPQTAVPGFATISPGLQFSSAVADLLFRGTATNATNATNAATLQGNPAANFMSAVSNTQTTGTLSVANDLGLRVGTDSDLAVTVSGADVALDNQTLNGNISLRANVAGTPTTVISINGNTGVPTAPTAAPGTNNTQIATTAFVQSALQALYPVGSIYINSANNTNPATLLGFGTWTAFGAGRVPVGFNASDPLFDTAEETGGSKDAIVVSHNHTATTTVTDPGHTHQIALVTASTAGGGTMVSGSPNTSGRISTETTGITVSTTIASTGSSGTNANLPPYITVYMWKRTA